jgi:acyl-[acyl carrier protein]--UDP-N-acetylglucosamine O-acyltransferase
MELNKIVTQYKIQGLNSNFKLNKKWFSSLNYPKEKTLIFVNLIDKKTFKKINSFKNLIVLTKKKNSRLKKSIIQIEVLNPKLSFFRIIKKFNKTIKKKLVVGKKTIIGKNVSLGKNVVIGKECKINDNVVINDNVKIGNFCNIKSNTVIGQKGFGTVKDENNNWQDIYHAGGVVIQDYVQIGALNTIARGTIDDTIIKSYNKFDDHVHIAHNCVLEENNNICAGVVFGGSVKVGKDNFFGLNTTIRNGLTIKNKNFIGQGTNIVKNISSNNLVYGNPNEIKKK